MLEKEKMEEISSQLFQSANNEKEELDLNNEKKLAFSISIERTINLLFNSIKRQFDRTSKLKPFEIKEIARLRSLDYVWEKTYGGKVYELYIDDTMHLAISKDGAGRKELLDLVSSMQEAEEKSDILTSLTNMLRFSRM